MKTRKSAGENTKILIRAINPTGSTLREATDASGLHDDADKDFCVFASAFSGFHGLISLSFWR